MRAKTYFDEGAKTFLVMLLIAQLFFTNGIILFGGMAVFFILFNQLQQPNKPAVFSIILIYHFLQVTAGIWLSNYLGKDINFRSGNTTTAIITSYIGLMCLFFPIIYFQNKIPALSFATLQRHADKLSIDKTFRVYFISFFTMNALTGVAFFIPSLTQVIFSLGNIKWLLFLLFGFQSLIKNRKQKQFYIFCGLEFTMGFYSYFSEFKTILFFIGFLFLCMLAVMRLNKIIMGTLVLALIVFGGVFWTSVKDEYRLFLNKGSQSQSVQVEKGEALGKLAALSEKQDKNTFSVSFGKFLDRLQYTFHLAKAMDRVPALIPYENGANWGSTFSFVFTPRVLNPDKAVYDASIKATKYTGIRYAGVNKGTSVSLGYFADGYIDFGYIGMFIPLLILGFIYGYSYFYFIKKSSDNYIFNYAVVGSLYMELYAFESDAVFLIGRLYVNLLVFFLLKIFFFPKLMAYIRIPKKQVEE